MNIPQLRYKKRPTFADQVYNFFTTLTGMTIFNFEIIKQFFIPPYEIPEIKKHMTELGVKTFPIVSITGFIIGLVLAMQTYPILLRFGATDVLPGSVAVSVVRELGPVITALIFAGRVSSGIGAELGAMRVTEQIDAMEVSGVNSFKYLVVTRVFATTMILPLLTIYVIFIAILGSYLAVVFMQSMTFEYYKNSVISFLTFQDFIPGVGKTFVFGYIAGLVGCYKGYTAQGGTEGVGHASTTSVVIASLFILIVDMVLVKLLFWLWP